MGGLGSLGAVELARAIHSGDVSRAEVWSDSLDRLHKTHTQLHAVVAVLPEPDFRVQGPLAGVPFSIKDSIDVADWRTTCGTIGRREVAPAAVDATLVQRLRRAGAVPIAKTNLPDLLFSFETDNLLFGRTNNPYDLTRTAGGSSGGEAALLAAGASALGLGSDAFGSVRLPAAFCGLAAIKPTSGRLPRTGHVPPAAGWVEGLWQIGPMARRVDDLLVAMPLLAYADGLDLWSPPVPLLDTELDLPGLRVAFYGDNGFAPCAPYVRSAVGACARFLSEQGAVVTEERAPGVADAFDLEMALFGVDGGDGIHAYLQTVGSHEVHPLLTNFLSYFEPHRLSTGAALGRLWERWDQHRLTMERFFARYDVVLCPVYTEAALPHGDSMRAEKFRGFSYTMAWNVAQTPAATVRCGTYAGLPVNVQVVARRWNDMLALQVCKAIEQNFGGWQPPSLS